MVQLSWRQTTPPRSRSSFLRGTRRLVSRIVSAALSDKPGRLRDHRGGRPLDRRDACDCGELSGSRDYGRSSAADWTGKCNAVWSGAKIAKGKWLLFTDADTRHATDSIARGLQEAKACDAALLSYSPKQEVHSFAERALMPVIFAELAMTYRPQDVCDPQSPVAAANGQYLLVRRDVYDAVGGHAAVAGAILEDLELARLVKRTGHSLHFRLSDVVSARMYRSFPQMWEGWTKNLVLLFPHPRRLALSRLLEFAGIAVCVVIAALKFIQGEKTRAGIAAAVAIALLLFLMERIRRAHFDWLSSSLAIFGLPLFAILLCNSNISHRRGSVRWKGREYGTTAKAQLIELPSVGPAESGHES